MSNDKRCGTCKHWGNEKDTDAVFRRCLGIIHDDNYHQDEYPADLDAYRDYMDEPLEEDVKAEILAIRKHKAVTVDGSGYFAALKVQEDFGCVLWEEKK